MRDEPSNTTAGQTYVMWGKITDSPEIPWLRSPDVIPTA